MDTIESFNQVVSAQQAANATTTYRTTRAQYTSAISITQRYGLADTSQAAILVVRILRDEVEHVLDDFLRRRYVPHGERALAAVPDSGREHSLAFDRELYGLKLLRRVLGEERHGERRLHDDLLRLIALEEQERAEHVFVGLWA